MKGILTFFCTLVLAGSGFSVTFPNDLFYHHHPDLAVADNSNQLNNKYAQPNGYGGGYRDIYRPAPPPPPQRNTYPGDYAGGPRNNNQYDGREPVRSNYNHLKARSYMPAQKLTYNSDGSINWASRAASDQQQQGQPWNGYSDNNNNNGYYGYSGKYEQEDMPYRSSPNPNYSGDQINRLNSYYDDQTREPYDRTYRSSPNPNHNGNKINSYYGTQEQQSQPDPKQYYNQDTDIQPGYYERGGYDNQYNRNNNGYQGYDYNNNQNSQDQPPAANATAFAGGIKLAGALPDDGYRRGEGTFYDLETHVGICGKQSKNSEYVVAVNSEQMGEGGRSNPHCGKDVEIIGPSGKTIEATIVDSCKTCKESGLDLSPAAFQELGDFSHGSIPIKWKFL